MRKRSMLRIIGCPALKHQSFFTFTEFIFLTLQFLISLDFVKKTKKASLIVKLFSSLCF